MQRVIDGWHSPSLNKYMEIVTYGHYGFLFPTAAADFLEYERFLLIDAILDLWGYDIPHDWPTWWQMMRYYLVEKF